MNKKTLGVLVAALVLALALTGVLYGLWYELLFIHGTVETGNVDAVCIGEGEATLVEMIETWLAGGDLSSVAGGAVGIRAYEEPNEQLMRSIEEKIEIPESRKDDFRREIMNYIGALAIEGRTFNYTTNERLNRALELQSSSRTRRTRSN